MSEKLDRKTIRGWDEWRRRFRSKRVWLIFFGALLASLFAIIWIHDVDMEVTAQDRLNINRYLESVELPPGEAAEWSYEEQVRVVSEAQRAVLRQNPIGRGIPEGAEREPSDLFQHQGGLCYDRSNVLEKIFLHLGFDTRHASLYFSDDSLALIKPGVSSHAVSEVRTQKGWMFVDSNYLWIGRDQTGNPLPAVHIGNGRSEASYYQPLPPSLAMSGSMQVILRASLSTRKVLPAVHPHPRLHAAGAGL